MSRDEENIDDTLDDGAPGAGDPAKKGGQAGGQQPDEEDMLFEPTSPGESTEQFGARQQFAEDSSAKWGGHQMAADEIGIPIESEPGYMSSEDDFGLDSEQELELVDDENQLEAQAAADGDAAEQPLAADEDLALDEEPVGDTVYGEAADVVLEEHGDDQATDGEFFVLDEAEQSGSLLHDEPLPADNYPVEEGWEPVGEGEGGDAWVEGAPADGAVPAGTESLDLQPVMAGGDDLAEQYYDQEDSSPAVIAAAPRRSGRLLRMLVSSAAAVMVVGAGAVVVLRPEWLGLHFEPQLVERVQVARPNVTVRVSPPPAPAVAAPTPVVPQPPQVVRVDPTPIAPPTPDKPTPGDPAPTPIGTTPSDTDPVAVTPVSVPTGEPIAKPGDVPRYLPVGDTMWIGDFDQRGRTVADWAPVRLGSKAFAQLANGNYFVGSVKAVNSDALILTVPAGEVTLLRAEIEKVAMLDSQEYSELQQATAGFLRLSNRNRLVGAILKSVVDDNYVLQMRSDRIVVPRAAVEQVVATPGSDSIRFSAGSDEDEWLRGIAAQQLRSMSTGVPAMPGGEGRGAAPKNGSKALPVKEAQRKVPVDPNERK